MPISDFYSVRANVTLAATTSTALLSLYGTAAKRVWLVGVRVKVLQTGAVAGNDIAFTLARPSATNTGTGLASGGSSDFSAPASIGQVATAWSTAPIIGTFLAGYSLPQTACSMWGEFLPVASIPAVYFMNPPASGPGKAVYLKAWGTIANTAAATFIFALGVDPTPGTIANATTVAGLYTPAAGITTIWNVELWITARAVGQTGGMTLQVDGRYVNEATASAAAPVAT